MSFWKILDNIMLVPKRILKTTLKREFFDAIYRGEKTEEYRDLSDFWMSRLQQRSKLFLSWRPIREKPS